MHRFVIHTPESAPDGSSTVLEEVRDDLGYVPNLFGAMADAPPVLDAYMKLDRRFNETSLSSLQRKVVLLAASRANRCEYCMAAHTAELKDAGFPDDQIENLRSAESLSDEKLEALRWFTHQMVERRGQISDEQIEAFTDAGFDRRQVLEVVLGVAMKTLSNYVNHIVETPLDDPLEKHAWSGETTPTAV